MRSSCLHFQGERLDISNKWAIDKKNYLELGVILQCMGFMLALSFYKT